MGLTIYHNPRCSKSRQTLALLQEAATDFTIVEYLKTPLSVDELAALQKLMAIEARDMMRRSEEIYKQLSLADESDETALLAAMAAHPILFERPVVSNGKKAVICRPPQRVQEVL